MINKNLPEIIPEFAIQKNAISRAIYSCSTEARKLIAMATALLPINFEKEKSYTVKFTITDYLKTLQLTDSGRKRELVKAAIQELDSLKIVLKDTPTEYDSMSWFTRRKMSWGWDLIQLTFNRELADILAELKGQSTLNLIALGKLQSIYTIRYYEIAMSYKGFMGKDGNASDEWFFERTISELREIFELKEKYPRTGDFRINIIDKPIEELNIANIGLKIECEYKYGRHKKLEKVRFICKNTPVEVVSDEDKKYIQLEKDKEKLKKLYPEQWQKALDENLKQKSFGFFSNSNTFAILAAENKTFEGLKHLLNKKAESL